MQNKETHVIISQWPLFIGDRLPKTGVISLEFRIGKCDPSF